MEEYMVARVSQVPRGAVKALKTLGNNIRTARLRRRIPAALMAERAGISRPTLTQVEKGSGSVAIGSYARVLFSLRMEGDLAGVAGDDELGRTLQDIELPKRVCQSGRRSGKDGL